MTGIVSFFAVVATGLPVEPIPQTNSVNYITRIASRYSGFSAATWLFILGVLPKVMAIIFSEIPIVVRGGIFTLICATVILTGLKVRVCIGLHEMIIYVFRFCVISNGIAVQA